MVLKLILLVIVVITLVAFAGNITSQGNMSNTVQNIQMSVVTLAYAGEFNEINEIVKEFIVLREIRNNNDLELKSIKLDERINSLSLVKTYCNEKISTLELVNDKEPYTKLQQICPKLKDISFSKAVDLFRLI